ncbi:MAG: LptF/LptG family permease, partial [Cyanobacteria bacterium NC_groundwater_1444_Ag_S-0.65um_54_12]|nr:LptF/LptG family permease [Cyanobacteria bacterium NC_groundwater_1444_Ag_S-0.65um_54_12]
PVLLLLLYTLPSVVVLAFPVAYLFSSLLGIGRMTRDLEITALRSSGISVKRILMPILAGAALVSVANFFFNDWVVPWSSQRIREIKTDLMKISLRPIVRPNVFFQGTAGRHFYVKAVDPRTGTMNDIFILDQSRPGLPQVITARTGRWISSSPSGIWRLFAGSVHKYGDDGFVEHEIHFKDLNIQFQMQSPYLGSDLDPAALNVNSLNKQIGALKKSGGTTHKLEVAYHMKFSVPLATFAAALIAAPLGMLFSRLGPYIGVALSVILVFLYYTAMQTFQAMGQGGYLHPLLAAWLQNVIFGITGIVLLGRVDRR